MGAMAGQAALQQQMQAQAQAAQAQAALARRGQPQQAFGRQARGMPAALAVPQGADAGLLAGCGDGNCLDIPYGSPFMGFPLEPQPFMQPAALIPIQAAFPDPLDSLTLQISCGNSLFYGCCARSFNGPAEVNLISIFSGANDVDLLCPGSGGLDINYFNTNGNECCCAFDFGCFSSFFPLIIEFAPVGAPSVAPLINMVIGGSRLQGGNACAFWPGLWPGQPGVTPGTGVPVG